MFVITRARLTPSLRRTAAARGVIASVDREAQRDIRINGVEAAVLERVRADLVEQSDAASFVAQVEEHATVGAADLLESSLQLFAAVAAQGAERLAGQALGMETYEDGLVSRDVAVHERDDLGRVTEAEDVDLELAVPRRQRRDRLGFARATDDHIWCRSKRRAICHDARHGECR